MKYIPLNTSSILSVPVVNLTFQFQVATPVSRALTQCHMGPTSVVKQSKSPNLPPESFNVGEH